MPTKLSKYCEGIMEAGWLAAVVLVPVFFDIYSSRIFEPDKITLLRSIALVVLVAWVTKVIDEGRLHWERISPDEQSFKALLKIPMLLPVLGLVVVYIISTIYSVTPRISLWGSYQRLQGTYTTFSYLVIFASMAANIRRRPQIERLITAMILSSLPVSLYGILQRYKLDPVPWGGDTTIRIASNMGNSIFVAAFLIMVFPITLGRVIESFTAILRDSERLAANIIRATIYVFIMALQVIGLYMSQSRGPVLGWLISIVLTFFLLSVFWRKRWMSYGMVGIALALGIFLLVFNLPNSPLEKLRESPAVGRFGSLLNAESNSALVRRYIWEGVVKLVSLHAPISYPDGSTDSLNLIRPLIGYGPESMYVAYNPFYVPDLGNVEKRNASPDRSHNETWDSIAITGIFGMMVYLAIFISVFYFSLKWLGLIKEKRERVLFFALAGAGMIIGAVVVVIWQGIEYLGVGIPFGLLAGVGLFIVLQSLFAHYEQPENGDNAFRSMLLIVLLAAVAGHFAEINFGIAIAVTRTYFWTFSGLALLLGYVLPRCEEPSIEKATPANLRRQEAALSAKKRRRNELSGRGAQEDGWLRPAMIGGFIIGLILTTLDYNYISSQFKTGSALDLFWNSFTQLPGTPTRASYGILALVLTTWIVGSLLLVSEWMVKGQGKKWVSVLSGTLGFSFLAWIIFGVWHAGSLFSLINITPQSIDDVYGQVDRVNGLLTNYYVFIFAIIFLAAFFLPEEWPLKLNVGSWMGPSIGAVAILGAFMLINVTNLRIIYADITFKMADGFTTSTQWPVATLLYKQANSQAPDEDHYYLFLGRSYLEQAKEETDNAKVDQDVKDAETDLKYAQKINPLNTDHTANLARLYSWWATKTNDSKVRVQRAQTASNYYKSALTLSPQNSTLWDEWAILYSDVFNQPQEALNKLNQALELDPKYNMTQGLIADYYVKQSRTVTDTVKKNAFLQQAVDHFQAAVNASVGYDSPSRPQYLVSLGNTYTEIGNLDKAIQAYTDAINAGASSSDIWKIQEMLARLYFQKGDKVKALQFANDALDNANKVSATQDQTGRIQTLIQQIQQTP